MKAAKLVSLVAAAGLMASGSVMAASQGSVGATSSGTSVVSILIPDLIRITDLADISFADYDGDGVDRTLGSPACVRTNGATTYGIVATTANGGYELDPSLVATTTTIPYTVTWGGTNLPYNSNLAAQAVDSTSLGACTAVADKLEVTITGANLDAAEADSYEDTITLTVTPE
jgi:spore coat protein U-like protein